MAEREVGVQQHQVVLRQSPTGRVAVLEASGELDLAACEQVRAALLECTAGPAVLVVVDLAGTTFIDSSCLGLLAGATKRLHTEGRQFCVANATGRVLHVLDLTRLSGVFDPLPHVPLEDLLADRAAS